MLQMSSIPARSSFTRSIIRIVFKPTLEHVLLWGRDRATRIKYSLRTLKTKVVVWDMVVSDILRNDLRNKAFKLFVSGVGAAFVLELSQADGPTLLMFTGCNSLKLLSIGWE